jgi:hypothetical protein
MCCQAMAEIFLISSMVCICPAFALCSRSLDRIGGIVKDDAAGDQTAAFRPEILFILCFETELAEAGKGDGSSQLVIVFSPIDRLLDILPRGCLPPYLRGFCPRKIEALFDMRDAGLLGRELLITPSKKNMHAFLEKVRGEIRSNVRV